MKALTLTQPWASLIVSGQKLIENRSRKPPANMLGQRFAVHASREIDLETCRDIFIDHLYGPATSPYPTPRDFPKSAIVGVATLERFIAPEAVNLAPYDPAALAPLAPDQRRWFFGPVGYVLADVVAIEPIRDVKGALGFWRLTDELEAEVERRVATAMEVARG